MRTHQLPWSSRHRQADYESYAHTAVAHQARLSDETIRASRSGEPATELTGNEKLAQAFALQLTSQHFVDAILCHKAESAFSWEGLADITLLAGRYLTVCALLNGFAIPRP